jgi:MSHA pilin protein MshD
MESGRLREGADARAMRGMTMIELVVAITIVAIAASAVLGVMSTVVSRGANAMVRQQAVAIADAYLEEILLLPVTAPTLPANYTAPTGQYARATWTYVDQYNNLVDNGAEDQFGNAVTNLSNYTVRVAVSQTTALTGITAANARRIDVTVSYNDTTGISVMLSGYRANF